MLSIHLIKTLDGPGGKYRLETDIPLQAGKVLAVMGPSGAGKTSLLRMIAGLMIPESGKITIESTVWYDSSREIFLPPQQRSVGMVFQDYGLFPHMTVIENLQFAIDKKTEKGEVLAIIKEMGLQGLERQRPITLSGGQQQRVALARAFLRKPKILLLDEPLAALDRPLRLQLQQDLKRFQEKLGCATLIISHDPGEVARLADEVIILDRGKIQFRGTPETLFGAEGQQRIRAEVLAIPAPGKVRVLVGDQILTIDYHAACVIGEVIDLQIS